MMRALCVLMRILSCRFVLLLLASALNKFNASGVDAGHTASGRFLSAKIAGYKPDWDVSQYARIDLDQEEFELHLDAARPDWGKARQIYTFGGNADGYAKLMIDALTRNISKNTVVSQGGYASGRLRSDTPAGATILEVSYSSVCNAGGLNLPDTKGCFGTVDGLTVGDENLGHPSAVENTYLTLAELERDYNRRAAKYRSYLNESLVMSALGSTCAFENSSVRPRIGFAKKASALLNVGLHVRSLMEDACHQCSRGIDDGPKAWDQAVAFYVGSLGEGSGKLSYALADQQCSNFGTCATDGTSNVNMQILAGFKMGQAKLLEGKCQEVSSIKKHIEAFMLVPLIQGTLQNAHHLDTLWNSHTEKPGMLTSGVEGSSFEHWHEEVGEAAAFAAAIVPVVYECNRVSANLIDKNMRIDSSTPMNSGFAPIKAALQSVYACIGITCNDVGGLLIDKDNYHDGAGPCTNAVGEEDRAGMEKSAEVEPDPNYSVSCAMMLEIFFTKAFIMLQLHHALGYL